MTYICKFDCGAETETLNELNWHYQSNHADDCYPAAALFWFAVVVLLPSAALGCLTTYFTWGVLPHRTALVIGNLIFAVFLFGGIVSLAIQLRDNKQGS